VDSRDGEVNALAVVVRDLQKRGKKAWVFANNHYYAVCGIIVVMPLPGLCRVAVAMFDSAKLPAVFDVDNAA
jgi:hypothetical protein